MSELKRIILHSTWWTGVTLLAMLGAKTLAIKTITWLEEAAEPKTCMVDTKQDALYYVVDAFSTFCDGQDVSVDRYGDTYYFHVLYDEEFQEINQWPKP